MENGTPGTLGGDEIAALCVLLGEDGSQRRAFVGSSDLDPPWRLSA